MKALASNRIFKSLVIGLGLLGAASSAQAVNLFTEQFTGATLQAESSLTGEINAGTQIFDVLSGNSFVSNLSTIGGDYLGGQNINTVRRLDVIGADTSAATDLKLSFSLASSTGLGAGDVVRVVANGVLLDVIRGTSGSLSGTDDSGAVTATNSGFTQFTYTIAAAPSSNITFRAAGFNSDGGFLLDNVILSDGAPTGGGGGGIPVPGTALLMGIGLAGFGFRRRQAAG